VSDGTDVSPQRCCSVRHEALPAAVVGVYDDGDEVEPGVAYCADCARSMIALGAYRVTQVRDPMALEDMACQACRGTGRRPPNVPRSLPTPSAEATVREVTALVEGFDDVPPRELSARFYQHGYEELRLAVDALLGVIASPARPARVGGDPLSGPPGPTG